VRLLADADEFDRGEFASPLYLLFAPVALLGRWPRWPLVAIWAAGLVYVLAWFFGSQQLRFLSPLGPAFACLAALGILALAAQGRAGRAVTVAVVTGALATGLAVSLVYTAQFVPVVTGRESEREFLTEKTSYYEGIDWLNRNLPPGSHVAIGHVFILHVDRPALWWSSDALPTTAGPSESRRFFRRYGITHAQIFDRDVARIRQLEYAGARRIARVTVHAVTSRTLAEIGPPETVAVYALPRARRARPATPSAQASGVSAFASSRERRPADVRSAGSSARRCRAAASARASPTGTTKPFTPSSTSSRAAPTASVATSASPAAAASLSTMPQGSERDGRTNTSACA
jgi:hypothetical protein